MQIGQRIENGILGLIEDIITASQLSSQKSTHLAGSKYKIGYIKKFSYGVVKI